MMTIDSLIHPNASQFSESLQRHGQNALIMYSRLPVGVEWYRNIQNVVMPRASPPGISWVPESFKPAPGEPPDLI